MKDVFKISKDPMGHLKMVYFVQPPVQKAKDSSSQKRIGNYFVLNNQSFNQRHVHTVKFSNKS